MDMVVNKILGGNMNVWEKIGIGVSIIIVIFGIGFFTGSWRADQIGDFHDQARITELEGLYAESERTNIELRSNNRKLEERLGDYFDRNAERYSRAREIIGEGKEHISEGEDSIERAFRSLDRLSEAIEILLGNE